MLMKPTLANVAKLTSEQRISIMRNSVALGHTPVGRKEFYESIGFESSFETRGDFGVISALESLWVMGQLAFQLRTQCDPSVQKFGGGLLALALETFGVTMAEQRAALDQACPEPTTLDAITARPGTN